jgi:hypothetical protein
MWIHQLFRVNVDISAIPRGYGYISYVDSAWEYITDTCSNRCIVSDRLHAERLHAGPAP